MVKKFLSLMVFIGIICSANLSYASGIEIVIPEKVFVNSRLVTSNSYMLCDNDIVSVRGYGRFSFDKEIKTTKKGRLVLEVKKY